MNTFVVKKGGEYLGIYTTTASTAFVKGGAMGRPTAAGVLAYATAGTHPYAFLLNKVSTDGLTYEERIHTPGLASEEVKAGDAVMVLLNQPGVMVATDCINADWDGSETDPAVGDEVEVGASGVLQKTTVGTHAKIGRVIDVDVLADGNASTLLIQLNADDLGDSAAS